MTHSSTPLQTLILAAGKGTRMGSDLAKVLHTIHGRPLLDYVIDAALKTGSENIAVIIGHQAELVRETFARRNLTFVEQTEQLGTGHAVLQARHVFNHYQGNILILCGDVPLLSPEILQRFIDEHDSSRATLSVLTTILDDPRGYGRVVKKDETRQITRIVEERDAAPAERLIKEINTGIYLAEASFLFAAVSRITNVNRQKEYYLTDIVEIANRDGLTVQACLTEEARMVMGINTPEELQRAESYHRRENH
jgi:UDP-N-acetylglucosamine diphosphorylase/glucosamine-1-phosphate N-acetyltransferase